MESAKVPGMLLFRYLLGEQHSNDVACCPRSLMSQLNMHQTGKERDNGHTVYVGSHEQ